MIVNKSFMMVKTISYALNDIKYQVDCLEQLKQYKFNRILLPNFSYGVFENVLTIHMEYIKGQQITPNKKRVIQI